VTDDGVRLAVWTAAEPAVTVIATTIPVLRSLFIEIKEKTKRRTVADETWTHKKTRTTGRSTVTVTADRTRFESEGNDDGDKLGLAEEGTILQGGKILQTREVAIEYEDRVDTESVEFVELVPVPSNYSQEIELPIAGGKIL
jgi:hypothetical protein